MTISQTAWAWEQTHLNAEEKIVLLALADGYQTESALIKRCGLNHYESIEHILTTLVSRFPITMRFPREDGEVKYILTIKE